MIFKIFTAVVFIAEIIIAYTVINKLIYFDKAVLKINKEISDTKSSVKDVCNLVKKISEQCVEFSNYFVSKINEKRDETIIRQLNKILLTLLLLKINLKFVKKLKRSKLIKHIGRGLSLLQLVV